MDKLREKAKKLRKNLLDFVLEEGEGHLGGSLSEIEILTALYNNVLTEKDKFILSKGHACHPLYLLLREKGYNPRISGHPDIDEKNGIYATTGSLGHGLPIGAGMAFARKKQNKKGRIYVLMSDGECQEGTTWEASDIASFHKLDNLVVIVDCNKLQALEEIENVSYLNLKKKFEEFGWYVQEIDGHNFDELIPALNKTVQNKPSLVIANTVKGKGIKYMENNPEWHGRRPTLERLKQAYNDLEGKK